MPRPAPPDQPHDRSTVSRLILIPTQREATLLVSAMETAGQRLLTHKSCRVALCGFGPITSSAMTMNWLQRFRPQSVTLVGTAGAYDDRLEIGSAYWFATVAQYGIGVGQGIRYQGAGACQFHALQPPGAGGPTVSQNLFIQRPGSDQDIAQVEIGVGDLRLVESQAVGDVIALAGGDSGLLLTVCAAAANMEEVGQRLACFPQSRAEEMEGYAVATACLATGTPLRILRGISNLAGDRQHHRWQMESALRSVAERLLEDLQAD